MHKNIDGCVWWSPRTKHQKQAELLKCLVCLLLLVGRSCTIIRAVSMTQRLSMYPPSFRKLLGSNSTWIKIGTEHVLILYSCWICLTDLGWQRDVSAVKRKNEKLFPFVVSTSLGGTQTERCSVKSSCSCWVPIHQHVYSKCDTKSCNPLTACIQQTLLIS